MKKVLLLTLTLGLFAFSNYGQKSTKTINYSEDGMTANSDELPIDEFIKNDDYILKYKTKKNTIQQTKAARPLASKAILLEEEMPDLKALKQSILAKSKASTDSKGDGTFVSESDSLALVAFYNSTNGDSWANKTNWLTGPVNSWLGINVNSGLITSILLPNNNLTGTIPSELGQLTSITILDFENNQISGELPADIGNLTNLTNVVFYINQLSGSIPVEIGNLTNLTNLDLDDNQLSGSIPSELGNLTNLVSLWLDGNQLTGEIPAELGNLTNLNMLGLGVNQLSGTIPTELSNLSNLIFLGIYSNYISGEIPTELGDLTNLQFLYLHDNQLSGSIPAELGNLSYMQYLYLYDNELTGEIPAELGTLSGLVRLLLYTNKLSGEIPSELEDLSSLTYLYLYENQLTGLIPSELGNISSLQYLYLHDNQLTGSIPVELGNLSELVRLGLSTNQLTGSIPAELGDLSMLTGLYLKENQLAGEIPSELGNLSNLLYFDLNENQLEGSIPSEIGSLANLTRLSLQNNQFTDLTDLTSTSLANLYLQDNKFSFGDFENTAVDFTTLTEIEYAPQAKIDAPSQTDNGNGTTTLTVTTDGTGNTFQWYDNKGILGAETANTLTVDNTVEGYYYCAVSNATYPALVLETEYAAINITMSHGIVEEEYNALIAFYASTNGNDWTDNTNWLSDKYVDEWFGITTSEGHLTELILSSNNLTGSIPAELEALDSIVSLYLDQNQITGEIPAGLGSLTDLIEFSLYKNQLTGSIPSELGNLINATYFDVDLNQLTGEIPAELGNLASVKDLWLDNNQLTGEIPEELGNLTNLELLAINTNKLTGSIPAALGSLSNLHTLRLEDNQLSGELPSELGNLSSLIYLYVYNNQLSGEIPSELGSLSNLLFLNAYNNQLSGSIPAELGSLNNIILLRLATNQLTGTIPAALGNLTNMQILELYSNQLTGSIPSELGNCSNLRTLSISNNQLSGSIPTEIGDLSLLTYFSARNNQLTGTLPAEIGNLTNLTTLSIRYNNIEGDIPTELSNLTSMQSLYLSNNKFTSGVDLSAMSYLYTLYVNDNKLSFGDMETFSISFSNPSYVYYPQAELPEPTQTPSGDDVILSFTTDGTGNTYQWYKDDEAIDGETSNELTLANTESGIFYCEISNSNFSKLILTTKAVFINSSGTNGITEAEYDALEAFYTSTNGDDWFNNTNWLSTEDVADWFGVSVAGGHVTKINLLYNNITGTIPTEIGDLAYLDRIEILETGNGLTGSIPTEIGNLENLNYLSIFNNSLSGEIPAELGNCADLVYLNLNFNDLEGEIPAELGNLTLLETLSLNNNELSGNIPSEIGDLTNLVNLYLQENNLSGDIPSNLLNLSNINSIEVQNNNLSGLADLSSLTNLYLLSVGNNYLTFEDLENTKLDVDALSYFYSPQANLEMINHEKYISEGNSITLNCENLTTEALTSENNLYAFFKDGVKIVDWSSDPEYNISSFASGDVGEYAFQVKNTEFTNLILYSDTLTLDINNAPSDITLSANSIDENSAIESIIGQLSTTDADAADSFTYSFVDGDGTNDADNYSFIIDADDLKSKEIFDFETQSEYKIYIQTEDADGLTYEKAFVITINDVNETPTNIILSANSIDENSAIGSVIGQFSTTDVDDGDSFTYTLVAGDGTNDADNASFTINSENLKTAVELDYETKTNYKINVLSTDADGLTFEKAFTVNVNDVTETGLDDMEELKWSVYPNPSNGNFTLEYNSTKYQVRIYDIVGNIIYDQVATNPKQSIDLNGIAAGTYFVSIQNNDKVLTKKLQIQ